MTPRLHHVGLIVSDREQVTVLCGLLGFVILNEEYVEEYQADCYFAGGPQDTDSTCIEFIVPRGGVLTRFNKGMGGLHHVAIEVDDLNETSAALRAQGAALLEEAPVDAGDLLINFLPPAYTRGLIVEYVQTNPKRRRV